MRRGSGRGLFGASVVVLAAALVLAGCKGDQGPVDAGAVDASPLAETSPAPGPTPESVDDPFAIPDEIDEDYLTLVMQELERIRVEGLRGIYADEEITDGNTEFFNAIYTPEEVERAVRQLREGGVTHEELRRDNLTPDPGIRDLRVARILDVRHADCVFVEVLTDDTPLLREGVEAAHPSYYYRTLVPRDRAANPHNDLNRTPWVIGWAGMDPDRGRVDDAEEHSQCPG